MKRSTLRTINRMNVDAAFVDTVSNQQRSQDNSQTRPRLMSGYDSNRGSVSIQDLNGGSSQGQSITNSYISGNGGLIPASMSNGSFNTVDAKPSFK